MTNQLSDQTKAEAASFLAALEQAGLVVCSRTELNDLKAQVLVMKTRVDTAIQEGRESTSDLARENDKLKQRVNLLRMGLEFYANPENWEREPKGYTLKGGAGPGIAADALESTR